MEFKWLAILIVGAFSAMFTALAVEKYSVSQCKIAYVQSSKSAEEITKICRN
jgi:hypothetical protein